MGATATIADRSLDADGGGRRVLSGVHELLSESGIDATDLTEIVVGVGPGSFTGVRIGIATALGLGQALGIPVTGASSLEALALGIADVAGPVVVAPVTDARRGEVFAAAYRARADGGIEALIDIGAYRPERFAEALDALGEPSVLGGSGITTYPELVGAGRRALPPESPGHRVSAAHLLARVRAGAARPARPDYQRLSDAEAAHLARSADAP